MGRRGRFVLQPRRISEIFVTSITLVTLALSGVAAAATPERAPSQGSGTVGTSPSPDPAPQPVRLSPTHRSAPPVTVTPVSRAPATTAVLRADCLGAASDSNGPRAHPVADVTSSRVEHAQPTRPSFRSDAQARSTGRPDAAPHRSGLCGPGTAPGRPAEPCSPSGREPKPNGVLLLLSSALARAAGGREPDAAAAGEAAERWVVGMRRRVDCSWR